MQQLLTELFELFKRRNAKYGPGNIARAGIRGILSRVLYDKCARLERWLDNPDEFDDESIDDTLADIANYCLLAILVRNNRWPHYELVHQDASGEILKIR